MAVKLFVGGLAFSTTTQRLRETFASIGEVVSASVVTGPDGRSRGFGFVEMANAEDADEAIRRVNGTSLDGRTIKVELSIPKEPARGGARRGGAGPRW